MSAVLFFSFFELTTKQLYDILALRQRVFIVEQNCFYQDADGRDEGSLHALMMDGDTLAGYARILPPGLSYDTASIGRIVLDEKYRHRGWGEKLVRASIEKCFALHQSDITITAQIVSLGFYEKLGFVAFGDVFDEAGIDHRKMALKHP
jgi:ElaA protein